MKLQNQDIKIGKTIDELVEGETFSLSETIKNREILLYLGLTNDDNPLYSQYDYVKELGFALRTLESQEKVLSRGVR